MKIIYNLLACSTYNRNSIQKLKIVQYNNRSITIKHQIEETTHENNFSNVKTALDFLTKLCLRHGAFTNLQDARNELSKLIY